MLSATISRQAGQAAQSKERLMENCSPARLVLCAMGRDRGPKNRFSNIRRDSNNIRTWDLFQLEVPRPDT